MSAANTEQFLKEYEQLCHKYGIIISACGCCHSPWLYEIDNTECHIGEDKQNYSVENHIKHLRDEEGG